MSDVDFKEALREAGIPTTEAELKKAWEQEVAEQGSKLSNTSAWSPFWRIVTTLITKPVRWLIEFIIETVLPNFFVKTAVDSWLDMLAWAVNVARKQATKAQGELLFTRASAAGALDVEVGTRVQSAVINGHVYELKTTVPGSFVDGQLQLSIPVEAIDAVQALLQQREVGALAEQSQAAVEKLAQVRFLHASVAPIWGWSGQIGRAHV